jgi:hypothetical protein
MDIPNHAELLDKIETFCGRHEMAETRFGREAVNNPNFLSGLRREPPVSPTLETLNKIRDFMHKVEGEARLKQRTLEMAAEPRPDAPEDELPFRSAPVNPTGASSPTSSSTSVRPTSSAANGSCLDCSSKAGADNAARPNHSCSVDSEAVAAPDPATGAGAGHQLPTRSGFGQNES